jgi:hypothetical protein
MEAETYLSSGYGIRLAIEERISGWSRFGDLAHVWMPGRLTGIQVGPQYGTPFFAATQVFDIKPIPRKWLAIARTAEAKQRFVGVGTILVTCSGAVGRATLASDAHTGKLISHDLLRVEAIDSAYQGWVYAYLLSPHSRAMTASAQYGHIIKHLETSHLEELPIPILDETTAAAFKAKYERVLELRNASHRLALEAEALFAKSVGLREGTASSEVTGTGFKVSASQLMSTRRRFDAASYSPEVDWIIRHFRSQGLSFSTVSEAGFKAWIPNRFTRIPAANGAILWDSSALTEVNPQPKRRIAEGEFDQFRGHVKAGWVLMARSGQTYGIIGSPVLATEAMEAGIMSDDVMRLRPSKGSMRAGYLVVATSHPSLGRPLVKALAYGSSIPHLEVADIEALKIVRLGDTAESAIADLAEASAAARSDADKLEQEMSNEAGTIIDRFMKRPALRLAQVSDEQLREAEREFNALAEQWVKRRPKGADIPNMVASPIYQSVIAMGDRAVRPILLRLRSESEHWFYALHVITGDNPVPPAKSGKVAEMVAFWLTWGRERGYLSDMD